LQGSESRVHPAERPKQEGARSIGMMEWWSIGVVE
jgi:hypothetical protein